MNGLRAAGLCAVLLAAACASKPNYLDRDVTRVVVLPPVTRAVHPDAWRAYWPAVVDWVASRGYAVIRPEAVERYFQGKYRTVDPETMRETAPGLLARAFGADGVFYAQITRTSSFYLVAASEVRMEAEFELVEGKDEEIVWSHHSVALQQRQVEGKGLSALIGVLAVAAAPMEADPAEFWNRCVAEAGSRLPRAGRDPERAGLTITYEGPVVKKKAAPAPTAPPPPPPTAPRESVKEPPYAVDAEGWTLAVAPRFVLISSVPGKIEEIDGGFVHLHARLTNNQGLVTFAREGGACSMKANGLPADWQGDLVGEYRLRLRSRPGLTLKEWLRARLLRYPSRDIQALID